MAKSTKNSNSKSDNTKYSRRSQKTYPEIKEEEIIKILNSEENQEKGKEILKK